MSKEITKYNYVEKDIHCRYIFFTLNNDPHGECRHYYDPEATQPWYHKFYVHGKLHGEFMAYGRKGEIQKCLFYIHGEKYEFPRLRPKPPLKKNRFNTLEFL